MRLEGAATAHLEVAFVYFWNRERSSEPRLDYPKQPWDPAIRVYCNDSVQITFPIRTIYLDAIRRAQSHILITQAYFAPDRHLIKALARAARRGVDVRVLVPAKSEHVTADLLAQRRFERLLRSGVRVFLYEGPILHAKTATIDGEWSMIGSCNLDNLSLAFNNEINVELFNPELARQMEQVFAHDLRYAREITRDEWALRPWHQRAREMLVAPLWPLV
jgi:cardiolipin synthase